MTARPPPVVTLYGLLGLIPFLVPPLMPIVAPGWRDFAAQVLVLYGALILSFLGGARWGLAVAGLNPSAWVVSLAMLPTLVALTLLLLPSDRLRLLGLAFALALNWVWDVLSDRMPDWYPTLRTILTAGAVIGLVAGAVTLP